MTAPLYWCRNCSSHRIDSASRWLVGSSSSSRSGASSSSLHNATRRRSPPEHTETGVSMSGHCSASMACSSCESRSQPLAASISVCSLPISSISASKSVSGLAISSPMALKRADLLGDRAERHLDVLAHGLGVVQRRLLLKDADREARCDVGLAIADGLQSGHDLQQRRLAHAVRCRPRRSSRPAGSSGSRRRGSHGRRTPCEP